MATRRPAAAAEPLHERLDVVRELIAIFDIERKVYLTISTVSFVVLLACAWVVFARGERDLVPFSLLFGSAGAVGFTGARLLRMWSDALRVLLPVVRGQEVDHD